MCNAHQVKYFRGDAPLELDNLALALTDAHLSMGLQDISPAEGAEGGASGYYPSGTQELSGPNPDAPPLPLVPPAGYVPSVSFHPLHMHSNCL